MELVSVGGRCVSSLGRGSGHVGQKVGLQVHTPVSKAMTLVQGGDFHDIWSGAMRGI